MYGSGLRLLDLVRLRVKDLNLERRQILVRDGKGLKDRVTMVPESLVGELREQLARARLTYEEDRRAGVAGVWLPEALARKYPKAPVDWVWFKNCKSKIQNLKFTNPVSQSSCRRANPSRAACRR